MNACLPQAPSHSFCVLPCSAENGEKEEVPEIPPEPPKKAAPPPPPPKKEGAGGAGLEFWGELEVQRVKFLVRTQQGHPKPPLPGTPTQHSHDLCPHPVLKPTCARLTSKGKPGWAEGRCAQTEQNLGTGQRFQVVLPWLLSLSLLTVLIPASMPVRTWGHLLRLPSPILYPELNPTEAMAYFLALSLQMGAATQAPAPPVWWGGSVRGTHLLIQAWKKGG